MPAIRLQILSAMGSVDNQEAAPMSLEKTLYSGFSFCIIPILLYLPSFFVSWEDYGGFIS